MQQTQHLCRASTPSIKDNGAVAHPLDKIITCFCPRVTAAIHDQWLWDAADRPSWSEPSQVTLRAGRPDKRGQHGCASQILHIDTVCDAGAPARVRHGSPDPHLMLPQESTWQDGDREASWLHTPRSLPVPPCYSMPRANQYLWLGWRPVFNSPNRTIQSDKKSLPHVALGSYYLLIPIISVGPK